MSDTPRTDEAQSVWVLNGCPERLRQTCASLERELAATKRELDETKRAFETQKHAFDVMRIACEANESSAKTAIERMKSAESRVRELEGFMGNARAAYRVLICSSDSERSDALKGLDRAFREMTNFGEAMPRKEGA